MSRKKRSELGAIAVAEPAVAPPVTSPAEVKVTLEALCPLCGKGIPERRVTQRQGSMVIETQPYFEAIQWDGNKPFGIALAAGGRGSFKNWEYIDPEDAPELFKALKARFIQAAKEWLAKGWLEKDDILG